MLTLSALHQFVWYVSSVILWAAWCVLALLEVWSNVSAAYWPADCLVWTYSSLVLFVECLALAKRDYNVLMKYTWRTHISKHCSLFGSWHRPGRYLSFYDNLALVRHSVLPVATMFKTAVDSETKMRLMAKSLVDLWQPLSEDLAINVGKTGLQPSFSFESRSWKYHYINCKWLKDVHILFHSDR